MKRLYRVTQDKKIAGVCSGLGEYFNVDPALIRIIFLVGIFLWGFTIVLYVICWFAMPTKEEIGNS
ncbi:MAG: PspC domain-containing protein [Candidatus Omnitrophica bacterium]|nr:PspC domain-containing protein [Candidatus Omnitrophota bacterium]MDD5574827.1 PspC domain-containing protein [Candidatus Omnitrophota bacterium]